MLNKKKCDEAIRSCFETLCGLTADAVAAATSFVDRPKRIFFRNRSSTILKCIVENVVNSRSHIDDIYQHPFLLWHILIYTNYFGMFASVYCLPDSSLFFPLDLPLFLTLFGACKCTHFIYHSWVLLCSLLLPYH